MDSHLDVDFERSDADPRLLSAIAAGIFLFVVAVPLLIPVFFPQTLVRRTAEAPEVSHAAPRLAVHPRADLARFKRAEDIETNSYGWTDRAHGVVRIPVTRAMDILARRGPQWPAPEPQISGAKPDD